MQKKYKLLILSIFLDLIGFIPFIDLVWAPVSGFIMTRMYPGKKGIIAGIVSFVEEIIPFSDIVPSFTIMWLYTNYFKKESELETRKSD